MNPPSVGQKSSKGGSACTRLKSVSPQDRVREFADDSLRVCRQTVLQSVQRATFNEKERGQESCPINET